MAFTQVTVTGTYRTPDDEPASGAVTFTPTAPMRSGEIVVVAPVVAPIVDGALTVALAATGDTGTTPEGVTYLVAEHVLGAAPRTYHLAVPAGASTLDLDTAPIIETYPGAIEVPGPPGPIGPPGPAGAPGVDALATAARPLGVLGLLAARVTNPVATLALSGPGGPSPVPGGIHEPYDTANVRRVGCLPTVVSQFGTDYHRNAVNGPGTPSTWAVEFLTDADDLGLWFRAVTDVADVWVWVDGRPTTPDPVPLVGLSPGSLYYERITFPTASLRTVRVYLELMDFGGLDHPAGTVVIPPAGAEPVSVAVLGDSWTEGAAADTSASPWPSLLTAGLGWSLYKCGSGGTGYATGGGAGPYTAAGRLDALASAAPDVVIVAGGVNDRDKDPAVIEAAAGDVFAGLASRLPSTPVIVVGPPAMQDPQPEGLLAARDAVESAALGASNVVAFVDPIAGRWFYGTGRVGSETGDGIADYTLRSDGVHPTRVGEIVYAHLVADRLVAVADEVGVV